MCILLAFLLETRNVLHSKQPTYLVLMAVGSGLLGVEPFSSEWAFFVLEVVWCGAAVLALISLGSPLLRPMKKRHLDETEVRPNIMGNRKAKARHSLEEQNFNEWYPFIVEAFGLVDKRYPIKAWTFGGRTAGRRWLIDSLTRDGKDQPRGSDFLLPKTSREGERPRRTA